MNRRQFEFWLLVIGLAAFLLGALTASIIFPRAGEQALLGSPTGLLILAGIALGLIVALWLLGQRLQAYLFTSQRMARDIQVIAQANPARRLAEEGPAELATVARAVNHLADRLQQLQHDQERQIHEAQAQLRLEHNRLTALIAQWPEGVLVCNPAGEILLYNPRAQTILGAPADKDGLDLRAYVGLGRSVFTLLDRSPLEHALESFHAQLDQGRTPTVRTFVAQAANGRFLRVRLAPIMDETDAAGGFVLTLEDVSPQLETSSRRDRLVEHLTRHMRSGLANLRAAIETLQSFPEAEVSLRQELQNVIAQEAERLSTVLSQTLQEYADALRARWRMEEITAQALLDALVRRLRADGPVEAVMDPSLAEAWLRLDTFALVDALVRLRREMQARGGVEGPLAIRLAPYRDYLSLELAWPSAQDAATGQRNGRPVNGTGESGFPSLDEMVEHHGGETWWQRDPETGETKLVMLLPVVESTDMAASGPPLALHPTARPEYYDFDLLFRQPGQRADLDATPLAELRYTVFDTETTGLDPDSDALVSISAVRIVNNRLLRAEVFDQLVDPQRPIPRASSRIHGIRDEMVMGQPPVEEGLRRFHRFVEESVLVAHNAAFDVRFLEVNGAQAGVHFDQPVLDTLLLSAVLHPDQTDHSLEAIAERLGVPVEGRHTSLGDALTTARIFLKMLPLLEAQGIHTLAQARAASEKTFFARIQY